MTSALLLNAMGSIKYEYIKEADTAIMHGKKHSWGKWVAVAASLVVVVLVAVPLIKTIFAPTASRYPYQETRTYGSYEELAKDYADPVYEAFSTSDEAHSHKVVYQTVWSRNLVEICVYLDASGKPNSKGRLVSGTQVLIRRYAEDAAIWEGYSEDSFNEAEKHGARTDYMVDGVEVQKYEEGTSITAMLDHEIPELEMPPARYESFTYVERVRINDVWYYVVSEDEASADSVATALAQIAAGL